MDHKEDSIRRSKGFSLTELILVLAGSMVLIGAGIPLLNTVQDTYRLVTSAQSISTQFHYARLKAVSSNEEIRVVFTETGRTFQVQTSGGTVLGGPFYLAPGITWNTNCSAEGVTFSGNYVSFLPTGNIPTAGDGGAGRARVVSTDRRQIDIVVSTGGIIRQSTAYTGCTPPI